MKIKLEFNGKDFEVEIKARDMRNLNATKSATMEVLNEIGLSFSFTSEFYKNNSCSTLFQIFTKNYMSIYNILKKNNYYD